MLMQTSVIRTPSAEPNVTPMIDVLLVLLIVFMTVVMQVHHTMDVQLPMPCTGNCNGDTPIVLEIAPGPSYRINSAEVARSDLAARLRAIYFARPEKVIQIAGRRGVRYDDVMNAMDVAKGAGVKVIEIAPAAATVEGSQAPTHHSHRLEHNVLSSMIEHVAPHLLEPLLALEHVEKMITGEHADLAGEM